MYDGAKEISDFEKIPMSEIGSHMDIPGGDDDFMDGLEGLGFDKSPKSKKFGNNVGPRGTINFDDESVGGEDVQSINMKAQGRIMQDQVASAMNLK